ncbi:ABC transporter ATP-binding protein [Candidatus Bathyarchaeota archaeon]|nr:ABC transporter ATP-binding protein [Candidatus Bathyarchaeota archaeon]
MVKVTLEKVSKVYKGLFREVKAVDEIDLEIPDKSFFTLLGPSGSGKTTTLRMIAGLETPTSGKIYFDDEVVNDVPPQRRNLAMVFQQPTLFPFMTVLDNMTYGLKIKGVPKKERYRRAREAARLLHIEHLLDRMPSELSGGERQRVDLGRAIVTEPRLFLLDEPLANLDARLREELRAEVRKIHNRLNVTTIFVTHDQVEAMTMSDKIAVMRNGRIEQVDDPQSLYRRPRNLFVAGFIGSPPMVFWDGTLIDGDTIRTDTFSLKLPSDLASRIKQESSSPELIIGVKPDSIKLYKDAGRGLFAGKVVLTEPLGSRAIVHVETEDKEFKVEVAGAYGFRVGEAVGLEFKKKGVYIFDKKTEKMLSSLA